MTPLSPREQEVGALLVAGLVSKGIAQRLGISDNTTKKYLASMRLKTGTKSSVQLAVHLVRKELA